MKKITLLLIAVLFLQLFQGLTVSATAHYELFADSTKAELSSYSGATHRIDSRIAKNGSNSLCLTINESNNFKGTHINLPMSLTAADIESSVLKFWIRLPKDGLFPVVFLRSRTDGLMVTSEIGLANYIKNSELGSWKLIQIPLLDFSSQGVTWNSTTQKNENKAMTWSDVVGVGFKMNAANVNKLFTYHIDDVFITSSFNPNDNTPRLSAGGGESENAIRAEGKIDSDGEFTYITLFDDAVGGNASVWHANSSSFGLDRRDRQDGYASFYAKYTNYNGFQGGSFNLENPVLLGKELAADAAIDMWVKVSDKSPMQIRILTRTANNEQVNIAFNVPNRLFDDEIGKWTRLTIPLSELPTSGTIWDAVQQINVTIAADWHQINGFGLNMDSKALTGEYKIMLDKVRIIKNNQTTTDKMNAKVINLSQEDYEKVEQKFTMIDISAQANRGFKYDPETKTGWIDQPNDMIYFDLKGVNDFLGVPFNIIDPAENGGNAVIVTRGQNREAFPTSVTVPIGGKTAGGIYFLHSAAWVQPDVGSYIVNYTDGSRERIPLKAGANINDWTASFDTEVAKTAYRVWNDRGGEGGFAVFAWPNPYPDKGIESITAMTPGNASLLMLGGITLTNTVPYKAVAEDVKLLDSDVLNPDTSGWFEYTKVPDINKIKGSALDVSSWALDAPAGKHGHITSVGDKFYFEDGTPVKFWGANLTAESCFIESKEVTDNFVDRIAAAGFNLIRFHHMDSSWVRPNLFDNAANATESSALGTVGLDRFEYLWAKCKEKGIYLYVDGYVSRGNWKSQSKFRPDLQKLMKEFYYNLFTHVNPYTGTTLANDPALVMVDIVNEDSLFWRNSLTWGFGNERNRSIIEPKFAAWLKDKYGTDENLKKAWSQEGRTGIVEGDSVDDRVHINSYYHIIANEPTGDTKLYDIQTFLYDVEQEFYSEMYRYLKEDVGLKCLVTGSNAPIYDNYHDMYSLAGFNPDYIDQHKYFSHPTDSAFTLKNNAGMSNGARSMLEADILPNTIVGTYGVRRVAGFPYVLSEWNQASSNIYSSECLPIMSAYASLHDWHPILFSYLQGTVHAEARVNYVLNMYESPTKTAIGPISSLMFMRNDIKEADVAYYETLDFDKIFSEIVYSMSMPNEMTMVAKSGILLPEVADSNAYASEITPELIDYVESMRESGVYVAVNRQMRWDSVKGTLEINSDNTQGYIGAVGGKTSILDNMDVSVDNASANVMLTSLTHDSIGESDRLLLTTVGSWRNTGMKYAYDGNSVEQMGGTPILVEPITGQINIKTANSYDVYYLSESGERMGLAETIPQSDGSTMIVLSADYKTMNYELVKTGEKTVGAFEKPVWGQNAQVPTAMMSGFEDMDDHWAVPVVKYLLTEKLIVLGDRKFRPDEAILKDDLKLLLSKVLGENDIDLGEGQFVSRETLFAATAEFLRHEKLVDYNLLNAGLIDFDEISESLKYNISILLGNGMLKGNNENRISPSKIVTRAEAAAFLGSVYQKIKK
ncbi:MAG: S-layer homology domain-containing protein [Firmicutes bacterium]|nr:S-layer homology domain-containing protein [Bacillota bacterium]